MLTPQELRHQEIDGPFPAFGNLASVRRGSLSNRCAKNRFKPRQQSTVTKYVRVAP